MGLKRDVDELRGFWRGAPWGIRALAGLLFLAAVANMASVFDAAVPWRGTLARGVEFYRQWVTEPVAEQLADAGVPLSQAATDAVILWIGVGLWLARGIWSRTHFKELQDFRYFGWFVLIAVAQFLVWTYMPNTDSAHGRPMARVVAPVLLVLIAAPVLFPIRHRALYFGPIAVALMTVLLLAAINAGLSR